MKGIAKLNLKNIETKRYEGKFRSLILRAKENGRRVDPSDLNGKGVYFILTINKDRWGNQRPYLYLYHKEEFNTTSKTLTVATLGEKATGAGGECRHDINTGEVLLDQKLFSRGGTHWDRQVIILSEEPVKVHQFRRSNRGNTGERIINL